MFQTIALLVTLAAFQPGIAARSETATAPAPEFTHRAPADWINSAPLTLDELRGRVVLIEFWTYDCINCRRTLPWLKAMHARYARDGLVVVGVHSPEFAHERGAARVRAAVERLGIEYAVMLDDDFSYWKALDNRFWPAFYLVGRGGRIERSAVGELHAGTARGDQVEEEIRRLLSEKR